MTPRPLTHFREYLGVYLAVRRGGHGWWRALRCCNDVRRGSWVARDVGELRAQMALIARALDPEKRRRA